MDQAPTSIGNTVTTQRLILKNTLFLFVAQALVTPLSVLVNAVMARKLGPQEFGHIYLAATYTGFGSLLVDWGQQNTLPALVAKDRARAGTFLGSALAWRFSAALLVYGALLGGCVLVGYEHDFQVVLALVILGCCVASIGGVCQDTVRGFERTDISAYSLVGGAFLNALVVVPTLFLGGRLHAVLLGQAAVGAVISFTLWRTLRPNGVGHLAVRVETMKTLLIYGSSFLALSFSMTLQPIVDAIFLSKFASAEAVGWHAAARKLVGVLVTPAGSLMAAMYPTLCRLHGEDPAAFRRTASGALRTAAVLVVPLALGAALYADEGVRIFSRGSFGPARDNLRWMSPFILLVYFTMMLGSTLNAAGLQRPWAIAQLLCVVVSAVADPFLVPWFQIHRGNGGLGICVSTLASEVLMVISGIWLAPRGILNRTLLRGLGSALVAGVAMTAAAWLLSGITAFVAAPLSVAVYGGCLWATGGVDGALKETISRLAARVRAKMA